MHAPSKPLRVALVGLTAGSLALLAACGSGETQAADGSSSGDKTIVFSPTDCARKLQLFVAHSVGGAAR